MAGSGAFGGINISLMFEIIIYFMLLMSPVCPIGPEEQFSTGLFPVSFALCSKKKSLLLLYLLLPNCLD